MFNFSQKISNGLYSNWIYDNTILFCSVTPEESCGSVGKMKQIISKLVSQVNLIPSDSLPFFAELVDASPTFYNVI